LNPVASRKEPNLLFISFFYPPANFIASNRSRNIAKYLARRGWSVTVLTPEPAAWKGGVTLGHSDEPDASSIHRLETGSFGSLIWSWYRPLSRTSRILLGLIRMAIQLVGVEVESLWIPIARRKVAHLKPGDFDLVLATASPFSASKMAVDLSSRIRCPVVLDFRDPWAGNPAPFIRSSGAADTERRLLRSASAVTTVSSSLRKHFERVGENIEVTVVSNAYDPEECEAVIPTEFGRFTIVYAGSLYPGHRRLDPVIAALAELWSRGRRDWELRYYGFNDFQLRAAMSRVGFSKNIRDCGPVPRSEVLGAVKGAGLAVVVAGSADTASDSAEAGVLTGKLFETIGLRVPMLVVAPSPSDVEGVLDVVGLGKSFPGSRINEMADYIEDVMEGKAPEVRHPEVFSWPEQIEKLDGILRKALQEGPRAETEPLKCE
jgi:glycosyltransferase involved in cell wall biosynthesis